MAQAGFSRQTPIEVSSDGINFRATMSNPFPRGIDEPRGASAGPETDLGQQLIAWFSGANYKSSQQRLWIHYVRTGLHAAGPASFSISGNIGSPFGPKRRVAERPVCWPWPPSLEPDSLPALP